MKTKSNIAKLLEHGYHFGTISQLNNQQINFLIERMKKEEEKEAFQKSTIPSQTVLKGTLTDLAATGVDVKDGNVKYDQATGEVTVMTKEGEVTEDMGIDYATGYNPNEDGDNDGIPTTEGEITEKFKSKAQQGLFFARCKKCSNENCKWCKMAKEFADSTTKKEYKKMPKKLNPEKKVSKNTNESYELEMEKELLRILENHINPSMTKTQFVNTLMEKKESMMLKSPIKNNLFSKNSGMEMKKSLGSEMEENTKEKERTKTKPGTKPKTRPNDNPFDDPNPGVEEKPKANTKEKERTKTKPRTKPKTKPGDNPFDDPNPDVEEKPKASDEKTKNEFLSLINKALNMKNE